MNAPNPGHIPVLREQVLELLAPQRCRRMMDCTVGRGGHAESLLQAAPEATLIGMDVDEANLHFAKQRLEPFGERVRLFKANFSDVPEVLRAAETDSVDLLLADLGFSSNQMDDPQRGLSFSAAGPLDMRLDADLQTTAADLVNQLGEKELADLIYQYGEERYSRRIAGAIVARRAEKPLETTQELAELVTRAYPVAAKRSRRGVAPPTRTFQALRIAVNEELAVLESLLESLPDVLAVDGRAGIISFHSLEDRRVKHAFRDWKQTGAATVLTKKPVTAAEQEVAANPRARSAKLRVVQRTA